jgi:hypothetical protein
MSERNGDRARFGKDRKRKALRRKRNRDLRQSLAVLTPIHLSTQRMSDLGWQVDPKAEVHQQVLHVRS